MYTWGDGSEYSGEWHEGMRHNFGIQTWVGQSEYVGNWKLNYPSGHGRLRVYNHSELLEYDGNYIHGKRNGQGTQKYTNGDIYKGML